MRHVVVIGSGFGALKAVRELRRRGPGLAITLAAPQPHFHYYPSLVWVPSGRRAPEALTVDVRDWLARQGAAYHQGRVEAVRDGGRTVVTDTGVLANDGLVVASGGTFLRTIPGIAHVHTLCAGGDAARTIRDRIREMAGGRIAFGFAGNPKHRPAMRGGPLFELVFAVDNQLEKEGRRDRFELTFFTPAPQPGVRLGERASAELVRRLERRGIAVHNGAAIARFEPDRVVTAAGEIASDLTIFMPGMTGPSWLAASALPMTESGHVAVDEHARAVGLERVYAIGDSAAFPGPDWQAKQAHAAELQAKTAARNLANALAGRPATAKVRHEIVCVLDDLDRGVLVYRDAKRQVVLPPLRLAHWMKLALERMFLRRYAPRRRPALGRPLRRWATGGAG